MRSRARRWCRGQRRVPRGDEAPRGRLGTRAGQDAAAEQGRPVAQGGQAEAHEAAVGERGQHVHDRAHAALTAGIGQVYGVPRIGHELGLECAQTLEVVEPAGVVANPAQERRGRARQRRQTIGHMPAALAGHAAHGVIEEQLHGAVGRGRVPQHVFEEPAISRIDGHGREHADDFARALGQEHAPLLERGVEIDLDHEAHGRHGPRVAPAGDQGIHAAARGCPRAGQLGRVRPPHGDALDPGTAKLLAQAALVAQHRRPRGRIPGRLLADVHAREGRAAEIVTLHGKEAHAPAAVARRRDELLDRAALPVRGRHRGTHGHPGAARVRVGHAGVAARGEPVLEPWLQDLE